MWRRLIFIVLQVLTIESVTSYPYKDYILAYIPIEEVAYLSPEVRLHLLGQPEHTEAISLPYNSIAHFYEPWYYQSMMRQNYRTPFQQTTGPVTFGGQGKAKGGVKITGNFGNQGYGTFKSYSAPPTPLVITPQLALPTTSSLPTATTLTYIRNLPEVNLPSTTISKTFIGTTPVTKLPAVNLPTTTFNFPSKYSMPSTLSVPASPMPFIDTTPSTVSVPTTSMPFIVVTTTVPNGVGLNGNVASSVKFSGMVPASGRVKISAHFC